MIIKSTGEKEMRGEGKERRVRERKGSTTERKYWRKIEEEVGEK